MIKIFISYSSKDREWVSNWLLPKLEEAGLEVCIDYRDFKIGRSSLINMEEAVDWCDKILLVFTPNWVESEWTNFEALMVQTEDPSGLRGRLLPLMLKQCELPRRLGIFTYADFKNESNWAIEMSRLLEQSGIKVPKDSQKISTYKLPTTGPKLFGREKELEMLDKAWLNEHTCLVTLIAWGGVGKTALVNHWLNMMGKDNYRGAKKVYGWSFYSQGAEEGKQASADEFLLETLKWFGDPQPEQGTAVEKGRRLARLVGKEKTLLILDGMEPLQYPPGEVHGFDGKLKDQGMRAFLRELAGCGPGLCLITSRERVTDLEDKMEFTVKEMPLEHLSLEAGALLLKSLGVKGTDKDIVKTVEEYDGHALALTLLGQYIKSVYKGDIRKRDRIPILTLERRRGRHARRVMEAYARWLGKSPERDILYIMGLFDRPVEIGAIEALKADPPIPGVTEQLQQLSEEDWEYALDNLRGANLLAKEDPHKPDTLDCHPLIREHFGERFQRQNPGGWKEAHWRLYDYFKAQPEKEQPETLLEMEPLFAAVVHGCKAGLHKEALDDVFWKRILREGELYIIKKLGAFGADLAALSHFFDKPWSQPADGLTDEDKALVLSWSAFGLQAVGRLQEALQPMKAGLEMNVKEENWRHAAMNAGNLSELLLTLGEVSQAQDYARQSVTHADCGGDDFLKESFRTTLADALHQSGQLQEAEKWFLEAEEMQKQRQPEYQYLYSVQGFQFCDLLLGKKKGTVREVRERAEKFFEWRLPSDSLLDISLDHLTAGRAEMMPAIEHEPRTDMTRAAEHLDHAVQGLREAGQQQYLVPGLLARAECYRRQNQFSRAWDDLNEALEIAQLGSMKLYIVDYHLEAGRLCEAEGKKQEAKDHFNTAAKLIEEIGYHRRDKEVEKLRI